MRFLLALLTVLLFAPLPELHAAELKLASFFSDHMVLQRDKPVKVCGWADAGATVKVAFAGQNETAKAGADGSWLAKLKALPASADGRDLVVTCGSANVRIKDVVVGEVWLLGGQSNMEMPLWWRDDGKEIAKGTRLVLDTDHPWLRILRVPREASRTPVETFDAEWHVAKSKDKATSEFSALGYFIGTQLHEKIGVPIGLVDTSWGGTIASAWCSREALDAIPEATEMVKNKITAADTWTEDGAKKEFAEAISDWEKRVAAAKAANKGIPGKPSLKTDPAKDRNFPAGSFNAMIWPLRQMTWRGVFFYQGENNLFDKVDPFDKTFPAVATTWRKTFGEPALPFCIFQICGWGRGPRLYLPDDKRPVLQELQLKTHLALPGTGFVVTGDYPHTDIHPLRKQPIAERAVRWARAEVYGEKGVTWGTPVFQSMKKEGARLILNFSTPGNEALKLTGEPAGFVIAGADGKFVEAKAEIVGRTSVAVWSDKVAEPAHVRYVWSDNGIFNLRTESGLPVSVFRTDDFPTTNAHM